MKTKAFLVVIGCLFWAAAGLSYAQDYSSTNQFNSKSTKRPPIQRNTEMRESNRPRPTGAIYEMSKDGLVVISPTAPASYGYGQKTLTANPTPDTNALTNTTNMYQWYGGIKLYGVEF